MNIRTRSVIIMLSQGILKASTLILSIVLVRIVTQETYGTFRQVNLVYLTLAGLLSMQLQNSFYYFIPQLNPLSRRYLLTQTIYTSCVISLVIAALMFFASGFIAQYFDNPRLALLCRIFALYPFVERLFFITPSFMISMDKAVSAGLYSLAASLGRILTVTAVFLLGYDLVTALWAVIGFGVILAAVSLIHMYRLTEGRSWGIDRKLWCEQLMYVLPLLAANLVGVTNLQLNKILISLFFSPEKYAVYDVGTIELPFVTIVTFSLTNAILPDLVRMYKEGHLMRALGTWQEAARKSSFVIFPCFVFLLFFAHEIIVFCFGEDYSLASWPFRIFLFSMPIRIAVYATMFRVVNKNKYIAYNAVLELVINFLISLSLLYLGGNTLLAFVGPTIGMVLAGWVAWIYMLVKLKSIMNISFRQVMRWGEHVRLLAIFTGCGLAAWLCPLPVSSLLLFLLIKGVLFVALSFAVLLATRSFSAEELKILRNPAHLFKQS